MRYLFHQEGWSIEQARARLERRRNELSRLLDWLDTDPSNPQPVVRPSASAAAASSCTGRLIALLPRWGSAGP